MSTTAEPVDDPTRARILAAARQLTERGSAPSISAVARAAGISRQGLYLHFPSRAALLAALVDDVDQTEDLGAEVRQVMTAPDGPAQALAWAHMQARRNPRIALIARALDAGRHDDSEAAQAWQDRTANRMRGAMAIEAQLRSEGRVHDDWSPTEAAAILWELMSFRVWDDLVTDAGLAPARYADIVTSTVLAALASPLAQTERQTAVERDRSDRTEDHTGR